MNYFEPSETCQKSNGLVKLTDSSYYGNLNQVNHFRAQLVAGLSPVFRKIVQYCRMKLLFPSSPTSCNFLIGATHPFEVLTCNSSDANRLFYVIGSFEPIANI